MALSPIDGKPGPVVKILSYLKNTNARYASSRELSEALTVTRQVVYDSIAFLRGCGYNIEASRSQGYRLISSPDSILPIEIAAGLKCKTLAGQIFAYGKIDSTNLTAHCYAKNGFLITGLALSRAINKITGINTTMKWPNDILYEKKKLAGILVELAAELDRVEYLIVGIGINVNFNKKDFPLSLQRKSTSLKIITKKEIHRAMLLQNVLVQFENLYRNFCRHGFKYISSELIQNSAVIGRQVALSTGKKKITGKAVGFDDSGGLIIKSKSGLRSYAAGEVRLK